MSRRETLEKISSGITRNEPAKRELLPNGVTFGCHPKISFNVAWARDTKECASTGRQAQNSNTNDDRPPLSSARPESQRIHGVT